MSKKEIDEELIEEFEDAQKEYNENMFEGANSQDDDSIDKTENLEEEQIEKESEEDTKEETIEEHEHNNLNNNDKRPFNTKKWLFIVIGCFAVFLIVFVALLLNKKNDELLMTEKNYEKAVKKIEQQEEKINKMSDQDKAIAGIKVESEKEKEKIKEKQKENQTNTYKQYENMTEEKKKQQEVIPREQKVPIEELDKIKKEEDYNPDEKLPAKFNLNDKIKIEVENQNDFGLCWDFASTSSLQTHYALKNNKPINLSKIHVDYLMSDKMYGYREIHDGGNFSDYESYLLLTSPVETKTLEYRDYPEINSIDYFLDQKTTDIRVTNTIDFPNVYKMPEMSEEEYQNKRADLINIVKQHIMKNGSVYAVTQAPDYDQVYFEVENSALYFNGDYDKIPNSRGPHAISIVGWDDNYSKEKFNSEMRPSKDGAFIALNSWDKIWGDKGYFYISYEDYNVLDDLNGITSISLDDAISLDSIKSKVVRDVLDKQLSYSYFNVKGKTYVSKLALQNIFVLELKNKKMTDDDAKDLAIFENLYTLDLSNNKIKDISFIKNMNRLGELNLSNNEIEDLTPLKDRTMYDLNLSGNKIKDVSILASMKELYNLDISKNEGVTGFGELSKVSSLNLSDTNTDFSGIANLDKLTYLDLSNNDISTLPKDLNQLADLSELKLDNCNINSVDELPSLYRSISLSLKNNKIVDLTGIKDKFITFTKLDLSNNKGITNYSELDDMFVKGENYYSAYELNLSNNDIEDITLLNNINVMKLNLANNKISNIKEFSNNNVKALDLKNNGITDLEGFNPSNINTLDLSENKDIKNIDAIKDSEVSYLVLENINLKDLSEVKRLSKVSSLTLDNNSIEEAKEISEMPNLVNVSLQKNNIKNINIDNTKLNVINIADNKLENISIKNNENLFYVNISNNKDIKNFWENIENNQGTISITGEKISLNSEQVSDIINSFTEKGIEENVFLTNFDLEYNEKGSSSKISINDSNVRRALLSSILNQRIENGMVDSKARTIEVIDSSKDVRIEPNIFSIGNFHQFIGPTIVIK